MTTQDYLDLITSAYAQQPNFLSTVTGNVALPVQVQYLLSQMIPLFDVDTAVGDQLDIIGKWVGASRDVSIPSTGVYFTWDDVDSDGWDFGSWAPASAPTTITVLPDDTYRNFIKAKIAANHWDGTTDGAYAIWNAVFTQFTIFIQDFQDMTYSLILAGGVVDSLTLALLVGGYLPLKPEGVRIREYIVPVDTGPLFAWDLQNDFFDGWDVGSWGRELS